MKFRFAFEKILEQRRQSEEAALRDYNHCLAKVEAAENEVKKMYDAIAESRKLATELTRKGGPQGTELSQIDFFIGGQGQRIETHKLKVRELHAIAEEAHEVLIAASKERKIYEKLRERRFEEYKQLRQKLELKRMDELVVTRFKVGGDKL